MAYDSFFRDGIVPDGAAFVAYYDGEFCGAHETMQAARCAYTTRHTPESAAQALDKAARPYFCDGRYGAWRAMESGAALPHEVESAAQAHHKAAMAYMRARGLA
jgi:hypothetical protein